MSYFEEIVPGKSGRLILNIFKHLFEIWSENVHLSFFRLEAPYSKSLTFEMRTNFNYNFLLILICDK